MSDLSTTMGELAGITNEELLGLEHELNCAKVDGKLLQQRIAELEAKNAELESWQKKTIGDIKAAAIREAIQECSVWSEFDENHRCYTDKLEDYAASLTSKEGE